MWIEGHSRTLDRFGQKIIQRRQNVAGFRMVTVAKLSGFFFVAAAAVLRSDNRCNCRAVVDECVDVLLVRSVALDAANTFSSVRAAFPVVNDSWRLLAVTLDASRGRFRHSDVSGRQAHFLAFAGNFHRLNEDQRSQKDHPEDADDVAFGFEFPQVVR